MSIKFKNIGKKNKMVTFAERMMNRKDIYSRPAALRRTPLILNRGPTRPTARMRTRPTARMRTRPTIRIIPRPPISPISRNLVRGTVPIGETGGLTRGITPVAGASGLTGGGLTGGITGDLNTTFGGIIDDAKGLIPTAVKIVGVVVVLKIVLWLVRGRGR